ncbi:spinster family MFS transporter [Abyssibacter sp.]|jgi:MFS family permease|uniref:spinster family MFS transporter n=1 Tax=Abyssibacter sp. TaxID=2320200 RepID=UPI000C44A367|nr:MFS transporter [Xanthomonadales bacterium]
MQASTPEAGAAYSAKYAWFVVAILMMAYVFSFVDRQILNLMVGPIRKDLGISDTEMSLLMGFSFAIFYTIMGIPLGRMADSKSRRGLVTVGIIVWSVMTALCGLAKHYWQLFIFRIGVGVGEAALSPAAYSMIADYFPPSKRATAISVYSMGIYIGSGIAFLLGGLIVEFVTAQGAVTLPVLGETRPWQVVFYVLGASGLLFSFAFLLIKEPKRSGAGTAAVVPIKEVVAYLKLNRRTVLSHNIGFAMIAFCSYGTAAWIPTYFVRVHGWSIGQVGLVFGLIVMIFGSLGIVTGGRLSDRWTAQGRSDAPMRVGLVAAICVIPFGAGYMLSPSSLVAGLFLVPATFFISMPFGVAPTAIQDIMPNRLRGQASALYLFIVNMIGLGIGPTAVAVVTDFVFHDDNMVGWSMFLVSGVAGVVAITLLATGMKPYRESLARVREQAT